MRRFLSVSCAVVVAALAVWVFASRSTPTESLLAARPPEPAPVEVESAPSLSAALQDLESARRAPHESAPVTAARSPISELRGRFRFPDGAPAANVSILLIGDVHPDRGHAISAPLERAELPAQTDDTGAFSLQFVSPTAFDWTLVAHLIGYAQLDWSFPRIERGVSYNLGDVGLTPGGSIVGRVVDRNGIGLRRAWTVHAVSNEIPEMEFRVAPLRSAEPTSGLRPGEFVLDDLEPGVYELFTLVAASSGIRGPTVTVRSGEVTEALIEYDGPSIEHLIAARFEVPPFGRTLAPYRGDVALTSPTGIVQRAGEGRSALRFERLSERDYTLTVDDPRFEPWRRAGLHPGTDPVNVVLTGSSALRLDVRGAATLDVVPSWSLRVRYVDAPSQTDGFTVLHHEWEPAPPGGLFDGIVPDRMMLIISAPGYGDYFKLVDDLGPEETRTINALLKSSTRIAGQILSASGDVPDQTVTVTLEKDGRAIATTRTDADGRFDFENVSAGLHSIRCDGKGGLSTRLTGIRLLESEAIDDLTLHLPRACYVSGQLDALPGADFSGIEVLADDDTEDADPALDVARANVASDGSFWLGPLAPGTAELSLVFPRRAPASDALPFGKHRAPLQPLGSIELEESQVIHRFDVDESFPGRLAVLVRSAGDPLPGALVAAQREGRSFEQAVWTRADSEGLADFGPLPSGRWNLIVTAPYERGRGDWMHPVFEAIELAPYEDRVLSLDVPFVFGELLVLDGESGEILSDSGVVLTRCDDGACLELELRTDGEGRIALDLPPGTYTLSRSGGPSGTDLVQPWIDWTFDGPLHEVVKLPY